MSISLAFTKSKNNKNRWESNTFQLDGKDRFFIIKKHDSDRKFNLLFCEPDGIIEIHDGLKGLDQAKEKAFLIANPNEFNFKVLTKKDVDTILKENSVGFNKAQQEELFFHGFTKVSETDYLRRIKDKSIWLKYHDYKKTTKYSIEVWDGASDEPAYHTEVITYTQLLEEYQSYVEKMPKVQYQDEKKKEVEVPITISFTGEALTDEINTLLTDLEINQLKLKRKFELLKVTSKDVEDLGIAIKKLRDNIRLER